MAAAGLPRVCKLNEFSIATFFFCLAGLAGGSTIENLTPILVFEIFFYWTIMVTCDQQEKVASSPKILLGIFLQIHHFFWRYAELNRYELASRNWARAVQANCCEWQYQRQRPVITPALRHCRAAAKRDAHHQIVTIVSPKLWPTGHDTRTVRNVNSVPVITIVFSRVNIVQLCARMFSPIVRLHIFTLLVIPYPKS